MLATILGFAPLCLLIWLPIRGKSMSRSDKIEKIAEVVSILFFAIGIVYGGFICLKLFCYAVVVSKQAGL